MNEKRFDHLTRTVAASRRVLVSGALVASAMALSLAGGEAGRKRGRKKGGKSGKGKPNAYGCLNLGKTCRRNGQCCSGVCRGKKGKRTCVAHDAGVCTVDADLCIAGHAARCGFSNANCACVVTTGTAPFCGDFSGPPGEFHCRACSHDTDCEAEFGSGAACVVYDGVCGSFCPQTGGTGCLPACSDTDA